MEARPPFAGELCDILAIGRWAYHLPLSPLRPPFPRRLTMMRVHANSARRCPPLGIDILAAELGIGPRPTGRHHERLQIVAPGKA